MDIHGLIKNSFNGAVIGVTGGTGTLGSYVLKRLHQLGIAPKKVMVVSRDEQKHFKMRRVVKDYGYPVQTIIGDIRVGKFLPELVESCDYIFHAAAMKHVPLSEEFPDEAIQTNVIGAQMLLAAVKNAPPSLKAVVAISTDKACEPINTMGMTKALQEKLFMAEALRNSQARINVVRYGNVIASNGSALPLFYQQLRLGSKVTITDRNMTRFFLFLEEATDLCFSAAVLNETGKLFVPKLNAAPMVEIVREMARQMKAKCDIAYVGVRAGEKMHEAMMNEIEHRAAKEVVPGILMFDPASPDWTTPTADVGAFTSKNHLMNRQEIREMVARYLRDYLE